jgi:hypothetical protein
MYTTGASPRRTQQLGFQTIRIDGEMPRETRPHLPPPAPSRADHDFLVLNPNPQLTGQPGTSAGAE